MLPHFNYVRPASLSEAVKALGDQGAAALSGGTDLLGCLRDDVFHADKLVAIGRLPDLAGVGRSANGGLTIGALTTITQVAENKLIKQHIPGLAQAASEVASPQLRNQGTIGGNLCQKPRCWYYRGEFDCIRKGGPQCFALGGENQFHCIFGGYSCVIVHPSDPAPMLKALNASVTAVGPQGKRVVNLNDFYVLPKNDPTRETVLKQGEVVVSVHIPAPWEGLKTSYRKVRARRSWDFALAGVALALVMDGPVVKKAGVVLSGAAPIPWRSEAVEEAVTGKELNKETISKAAEAVIAGAEPLEKNEYKLPLFKGVIRAELSKMAG